MKADQLIVRELEVLSITEMEYGGHLGGLEGAAKVGVETVPTDAAGASGPEG